VPKRQDVHEEWAIAQLEKIIQLDRENRDALPGSVVKLVKEARNILKKRRRDGQPRG
jgi:hypothetical protein